MLKEENRIERSDFLSIRFCCPTWIRTKTNSTKNCRTTIILSGSVEKGGAKVTIEKNSSKNILTPLTLRIDHINTFFAGYDFY